MSKQKWTILIIVAVVAVIVIIKYVATMSPVKIDSNAARTEGPVDAKVQIVEFVDFQCPSCANGFKILKNYMAKYPKDIRVQMKYFPLYKIHAHAKRSVLYSECAARQGKFWPFVDKLFERQAQWAPMINVEAAYTDIARESHLDLGALTVCLNAEETIAPIEQDRQMGTTLSVASTPTYFINNKMVVGAKSLQDELNTLFPEGK